MTSTTPAPATDTLLRSRKPAVAGESTASQKQPNYDAPPQLRKNWTPPEFTVKQIWDAIPSHCFKRNVWRSLSHVVVDCAMAAALALFALHIDTTLAGWSPLLPWLAWPVYWVAQGVVCTGLWVIAHECGHRAFSDYAWVDNTVGYIIHTALLVPFFSWKFTHSKHHKANAHMNKDQVFVPSTRSDFALPAKQDEKEGLDDHSLLEDSPIMQLKHIVVMLVFGWPAYLLFNISGQKFPGWVSHYRPDSPIFDPKQYHAVLQSDVGLVFMLSFLGWCGYTFGALNLTKYYVVPYLFVNFWLVLITYLQHTDARVPHYRDGEFNFVRGSLSTVDRNYGILNHFFHHIGDTHVVHHLFSQMPHYNAEEATEAVKKVLGEYYVYDPTNVFVALWRSTKLCRFVEDTGDVLWYKH